MSSRTSRCGHLALSGVGPMVILLLLILAGANLHGPFRNWRRLTGELADARRRLDELQVLYPLYAELASLERPGRWPGLSSPATQALSEPEVAAIPERFMEMAARGGMEIGAVSPRVETDGAGRRRLDVELRGTGPYRQLQPFLMELARMPSLERIQRLEVRREALEEQFAILARLALEQEK